MKHCPVVLTFTLMLSGCVSSQQNDGMNATLWLQTAAEYQGNSRTVFNTAASRLADLVARQDVTADIDQAQAYGCRAGKSCAALARASLMPAVVLDIDETVLDNSNYQARLVSTGSVWRPDTWDAWVAERTAGAVPGAVQFVQQAEAQGVAVFYLTNRSCAARPGSDEPCPQKTDTRANLLAAGFSAVADDNLILRGERPAWNTSEKQVRRQFIAERYRILMLIGDDLGDLASNVKQGTVAERASFVTARQHLYGEFWFQLSNPTYGSWLTTLGETPKQDLLRLSGPLANP